MRIFTPIIAALALLASAATHAGVVASMDNESGGRIDLSDVEPPASAPASECAGRAMAKAWGGGPDIYGCWKNMGDGSTVIAWLYAGPGNTHVYRTYRSKSFTLTPYGNALLQQGSSRKPATTGRERSL